MITKQFQDPMTGELISLIPLVSAPNYIDNIIYFNGQVGDPYLYYKRYIEDYVDIRWFGAIGDGSTDDSQAFINALSFCNSSQYNVLLIPDGYLFNLNGEDINVGTATLLFEGGILKNANLIGGPHSSSACAWIDAGCYKIFDLDIIIVGRWDSAQGDIWVDWFGSIANDYHSVDLKHSIEALSNERMIGVNENNEIITEKIFKVLSLNAGTYFSDECNIKISSLRGKGIDVSIVEFKLQNDNDFGFLIGEKSGTSAERTENNTLTNFTIYLGSKNDIYFKGVAGLVIGAVHKPLIENFKITTADHLTPSNKDDLLNFYNDIGNRYNELNCGVLIDGDGELAMIKNLFTYSQVGIYYKSKFDIINCVDYVHWCRPFGFCTIFIENETGMNSTFTGSQSWNQGLFGLYAMPSISDANFTNWLIENLRIEQLNHCRDSSISKYYIGANIFIGNQNWLNNLIIRNTMMAATSNGIILNKLSTGFIELDNIKHYYDDEGKIALQFELIVDSISCIKLKNVEINGDFLTENAISIESDYHIFDKTREGISKTFYGQRNTVLKEVNNNIKYEQKEIIDNDNTSFISILNSNTSSWLVGQKCKKINITVLGNNSVYYCTFYYFKNKTYRIVEVSKDSLGQDEIVISGSIINGKFAIVINSDSVLYLFNRIGEQVFVNIVHEDMIF